MAYAVSVVDAPALTIAGVTRSASMHELGAAFIEGFDAVYAHLNAANVTQRGRNVAYYTDVRVKGNEMSFDVVIGVEVGSDVPASADADVRLHETPAGPAATTTHWGDYTSLPEAHTAIHEWCRANGREFGRNWEVYGDWHDNPAHVRTDVYYELKT